jgi:hypothetical protein
LKFTTPNGKFHFFSLFFLSFFSFFCFCADDDGFSFLLIVRKKNTKESYFPLVWKWGSVHSVASSVSTRFNFAVCL